MSFATQHGVQYAVSFFLSLVCKAAVPLFYMVSGALLLGKNESFGGTCAEENSAYCGGDCYFFFAVLPEICCAGTGIGVADPFSA